MKKFMLLAPVAALALAACSSDAVVEQSAQTLAAKNGDLVLRPQVGNATRGTVYTTSSLKKFDIDIAGSFQKGAEWTSEASATPLTSISDVMTGSGSSWTFGTLSGTDKYWWNDNSTEATFQAKAPSGTSLTDFEPSRTDASSHADLITAFNKGTRDLFKTGVPLNFKHALSQIVIQAKNADNSKVKIEVAGIRLKNVANKATLTPPTSTETFGTWSTPTGSDPYLFGSSSAKATTSSTLAAAASNVVTGSPMFLIPQQLTENSAISILVRVTNTESKVAVRDVSGKFVYTKKTEYTSSNTAGTETDATESDKLVPFNGWGSYNEETKKVSVANNGSGDATAYLETQTIGEEEKSLLKKDGDAWTYTEYTNATDYVVYTLKMDYEVIFPRVGRANTTEDFGYVYAPSAIEWVAGNKYTYTLNFSADSYGLVDGDKASDETDTTYPLGALDYGVGGKGSTLPLEEDEPVVDTPVELFFTTVTVDEWQEGDDSAQNKDM